MNTNASRATYPLSRPDLDAIFQHRNVMTQYAAVQGEGLLRDQLLAVTNQVYRIDVELTTMLDGVCGSLANVQIDPYLAALRELEQGERSAQQDRAMRSYQDQIVNEVLDGLRAVREHVDALNGHLLSVQALAVMDTRELSRYAELLLIGVRPLGQQSHQRSLEFLLLDLAGPSRVTDARQGYVDEIEKLISPVEFFCQATLAVDTSSAQFASEFKARAAELTDYLQTLRREWRN